MTAALLAAALSAPLPGSHAIAQQTEVRMLVQSSPLAGFRYYDAKQVWNEMKVGDALTLVREPHNAYDSNAVRVEWRGRQLGYVPRNENRAVSFHMDRGGAVEARISKLQEHRNPRQRIEFEVLVRL
ncbi:MAG: HIRAN protein [Betaproteobacteria bacterium]|nr:HIRAN protein [Betaproteobacteria bacterium]